MTRALTIPPAAWLGLFGIALIWGASFLSNRIALDEIPVLTVVLLRVGGAAVFLWAYVLVRRRPLPRGGRIWAALTGMAVLNNVIPFTLIVWGQQYIASGLASILNASTAIFGVVVAAIAFRDERLTARKAAGVGLGFAGVAVAMGVESLKGLDLTSLAQLALLGSSLSYALAGVWGRVTLRHVAPETAAAATSLLSALILAPMALVHDGVPQALWSWPALAAVGYLAVVATGVAFIIFYRLLPVVGASNLLLVTLMVAPIAILLGALVLDEALAPRDYLGFALLALGLSVLDGRLWRRRGWLRRG